MTDTKASLLNDVSDTALWVATYRALENERPDALFKDPFAHRLTGDRGRQIAGSMKRAKYTSWQVVIRTRIIDDYIRELIAEGVDTVINLGAGLDARPYRMDLPKTLTWVEVDYPHMIERKAELLADATPVCKLERVKMDLADRDARKKFLTEMNARTQKALILTEGVIPYLTEEQTQSLAEDLREQAHFKFWLVEYMAPFLYRYFKSKERVQQMKNAPFQFFPEDWFGFFANSGWKERETRYIAMESRKHHRPSPMPLWMRILSLFMSAKKRAETDRFTGYILLVPH